MGWWARLAAWRLVLATGLVAGVCPVTMAAGGLTLLTDRPLPMAMRDGGVAAVTVRAIPFALGSGTLDAPTAAALDAYLAAVATDCFLFAQAIGHVRPGPQGDGDTLTAHRLARARADAVSAALLMAGLPADSVTSVWDQQFTSREARVTLWMFARPAGQDCDGTLLPGAATQVAVIPARALRQPVRVAAGQTNSEPAPGIHVPDPTASSQYPAGVSPVRLSLVRPAQRAERLASEVDEIRADANASAAQAETAPLEWAPPIPQASPAAGGQAAQTAMSDTSEEAVAPPSPVAIAEVVNPPARHSAPSTAVDAEPQAGPDPSALIPQASAALDFTGPRIEIAFQPDSSYFTDDAVAQLEGLLTRLRRDAAWEVELQAAVGDVAGGLPADRALAYNQWLADRRQSRVEDWLGSQSEAPMLRVRRTVLPHDPSRRVLISARPLP